MFDGLDVLDPRKPRDDANRVRSYVFFDLGELAHEERGALPLSSVHSLATVRLFSTNAQRVGDSLPCGILRDWVWLGAVIGTVSLADEGRTGNVSTQLLAFWDASVLGLLTSETQVPTLPLQ